jgi:hypothetical protein
MFGMTLYFHVTSLRFEFEMEVCSAVAQFRNPTVSGDLYSRDEHDPKARSSSL